MLSAGGAQKHVIFFDERFKCFCEIFSLRLTTGNVCDKVCCNLLQPFCAGKRELINVSYTK